MKMSYYPICDACIEGRGDECHTPGCIFCFCDTPLNLSRVKDWGQDAFEVNEMDADEIANHRQD